MAKADRAQGDIYTWACVWAIHKTSTTTVAHSPPTVELEDAQLSFRTTQHAVDCEATVSVDSYQIVCAQWECLSCSSQL